LFYSILLLISAITSAYSAESSSELKNEYFVDILTEEDGFISSKIYSIIQDNQGFIWFGTAENGVMRYDGREVTLFEFDSINPNGLSHNYAGNLMLDHEGKIWIGTWGGGANIYDPKTGKFIHFTHESERSDSLSSNRIQTLFHDQEGTIWLGSYENGLNRYLGNTSFEHIKNNKNDKFSLSHNRIWDIEDNDINSLWIATSFGLNLYNKRNKTFSHLFPVPENLTPTGANEIRNILKTSTKKIYIGTQMGPFIFDKQTNVFTPLKTINDDNLGQVNSMIEDHAGNIWIVTSKGLFRKSYTNNFIEEFKLEHNHGLRIIFEDSSRTLWVTNEHHGIYKITPNRKFKTIINEDLVAPNGITIDSNGDLLIASSLSALYKWHVSSQTLETLSPPIFSNENSHEGNRLLDKPIIFLDGMNNLWLVQDDGLAKVNLITKKVNILEYPPSKPDYQQFRELRAVNMDRHGVLWIGTYKNGIYLYTPSTESFTHVDESLGLSHPEVFDIFKDNKQRIWVGTGDGLNLWDEESQRFIIFKHDVNQSDSLLGKIIQDIHQSKDGKIWIGTQKGLNLFIPETQTFKHFDKRNGLPTSLVRAITEDSNGSLWITTNKGVSKLNPRTEEITNFDRQNGLSGLNYYSGSLVTARDDILFTSSQRGVEFFDTSAISTNNNEFNIVLTKFNKMGKPVKLDTPYSYITDIQLSYLDYFFSFEFSVVNFISPNKNKYSYKLEGYDDNWIDIGHRNVAAFTSLDGGSYKFLARATNSNGEWGEKILSINLTISPPPWKTWWAYILYILAILIILLIAINMRTRLQKIEIQRQKQFVAALEEQVSEKIASLNTQAQDLLKANQKLEILTYKDGLTGLYNRRYFDIRLKEEINRHYRQNQPLSLILADIDHFKRYNDFYGHQSGDNTLKQVAECIITTVARITDANCRYGGEEFAIILPNTSVTESTIVAERLCSAIESMKIPHEKSNSSAFITLTLGVVTILSNQKTSVESIVLSADKALYLGKSNGRNCVFRAE